MSSPSCCMLRRLRTWGVSVACVALGSVRAATPRTGDSRTLARTHAHIPHTTHPACVRAHKTLCMRASVTVCASGWKYCHIYTCTRHTNQAVVVVGCRRAMMTRQTDTPSISMCPFAMAHANMSPAFFFRCSSCPRVQTCRDSNGIYRTQRPGRINCWGQAGLL